MRENCEKDIKTPQEKHTLSKLLDKAKAAVPKRVASEAETEKPAAEKTGGLRFPREELMETRAKVGKAAAAAAKGIRTGSEVVGRAVGDARLELERKTLRPVFAEELRPVGEKAAFSPVIVIVPRDKRREESVVCAGAVGYWTSVKGMDFLNLYQDAAGQLGLDLYPRVEETFYHENPFCPEMYIELDDYFNYLKKARVDELERIAQDLGAKHVTITFREKKEIFVKRTARQEAAGRLPNGGAKAQHNSESTQEEYTGMEVAADIRFSGNVQPVVPKLVYFKRESDIEQLIQMRTSGSGNPVQSKTYHFQCSRLSGMNQQEASKLDAALAQLKCGGTATFSSKIQQESRTELEYHIEF